MFEAEIARGAKLLDKDDPGWALENAKRPINLGRLDMANGFTCVLGQHGGDFLDEALRLFRDSALSGVVGQATLQGFNLDSGGDYPQLTAEWRAFILKRRKAARSKKP